MNLLALEKKLNLKLPAKICERMTSREILKLILDANPTNVSRSQLVAALKEIKRFDEDTADVIVSQQTIRVLRDNNKVTILREPLKSRFIPRKEFDEEIEKLRTEIKMLREKIRRNY